jgi:DnaJ-class molecular chaperone
LPQDVFARISRAARQASFQAQTVCPHCGGLKWKDGSVCSFCGDSGTVITSSIHSDSQWLAGDKERVTADELAEAFNNDKPTGRVRALIQFPGLAARLDDEGKEALWQEVRRSPTLALFGHAPDVMAEIGGAEHVAQAAREYPLAARASLRALPVIREHHPRGSEIADAIASKGQEGE